MSYSNIWDDRYINLGKVNRFPWSDLIAYVIRYARPDNESYKILELGGGIGTNFPFFESLGVEYFSIDGCEEAVRIAKQKFPRFKDNIVCGDFTKEYPFNQKFDLIVDRSSLAYDNTEEVKKAIKLIYDNLKPNGKFIGIDWFSTKHSEYKLAQKLDDEYTLGNFSRDWYNHHKKIHFSDMKHLIELFSRFEFIKVEEKIIRETLPDTNYQQALFNFAVKKVKK